MTPMKHTLALALVLAVGSCGGDDGGSTPNPDAPPCVPGVTTLELTSPTAYACHAPFEATIAVTNRSCASITIQDISIAATVTSGPCAPAGPGTYQPTTATVARGATVTVFDLTGGPFCCLPSVCPASFQCDERFDFTVATSAGDLTALVTAHLSLDGCERSVTRRRARAHPAVGRLYVSVGWETSACPNRRRRSLAVDDPLARLEDGSSQAQMAAGAAKELRLHLLGYGHRLVADARHREVRA